MEIRQITEGIAVAGQLSTADIPAVAAMGIRTLISNRPDSESGTVPHEEIEAAARSAGIAFHYLPVVSGSITPDNVADMAALLNRAEQPVLAYCRSGMRCANLLQLINPQH